MVWMKKIKDGAHKMMHHGKPIKVGAVLDVERAVVGRYKDAGFEVLSVEDLALRSAEESKKAAAAAKKATDVKADAVKKRVAKTNAAEDAKKKEEAEAKLLADAKQKADIKNVKGKE